MTWHYTLMPSIAEVVRSFQQLVVSCMLRSSQLLLVLWSRFTCARSNVQKSRSVEFTVCWIVVVDTSSKSRKSLERQCSSLKLSCPSTNPSASLLTCVPTPVDRLSHNASSITGKSSQAIPASHNRNHTPSCRRHASARDSRRVCQTCPNTTTRCKLCAVFNLFFVFFCYPSFVAPLKRR